MSEFDAMVRKHQQFVAEYGNYAALSKKLDSRGNKMLQDLLKDLVWILSNRFLSQSDDDFVINTISKIKALGVKA